MIEVVAALIWDNGKFLACQRPAHKTRGLLWEFVGGKVEPGETKEQALIRECKEELDVTLSVGDIFAQLIHEYPDMNIRLTLFNAWIVDGCPKKIEHNDICWITPDEIPCYDFCPADVKILEKIMLEFGCSPASIRMKLKKMQDLTYKEFHCRLMPTVSKDAVIGVKIPQLRQFAKQLRKKPVVTAFLQDLPHKFYDENNLHAILISELTDTDETIAALDTFLPYVDNWATCDIISPKAFKKCPHRLDEKARQWMQSTHTYTIRFGIGILLRFYLDDAFDAKYLSWVSKIRSEEYYVNMMIAWFFATALAKQYSAALPYIENNLLEIWTHNKAIQKAIESYRITADQKAFLRALKRKGERTI